MKITLHKGIGTDTILAKLHFDEKFVGKNVKIILKYRVKVNDNNPVDAESILYSQDMTVTSVYREVEIPLSNQNIYSYDGEKIEIGLFIEIQKKGSLFAEKEVVLKKRISKSLEQKLGINPKVLEYPEYIIEPQDAFNIVQNFKVLDMKNRIKFIGLVCILVFVSLVGLCLGLYNDFFKEGYSRSDDDSVLGGVIGGIVFIGWILYGYLKSCLRTYMTFFFKKEGPKQIRKGQKISLRSFIGGVSRVDLHNIVFRIVAVNVEKGKYIRGKGSNRRIVGFSHPVRGLIIFEKNLLFISKNVDISEYLKESINFDEMFEYLYPENGIGNTHGLFIRWEVQLLSRDFVDQELVGNNKLFTFRDFLDNGKQ